MTTTLHNRTEPHGRHKIITMPPQRHRHRHHHRRHHRCTSPKITPSATAATTATTTLPLLLLLLSTTHSAYLGPTYCNSKPGTTPTALLPSASLKTKRQSKRYSKGYKSYNHLLFDLVELSTLYRNGQDIDPEKLVFKICPGSVIDLDSGTLPLGYLPIDVPRVVIQCGESGERGVKASESGAGSLNNGRFVGINNNYGRNGLGGGAGSGRSGAGTACIIRGGGKRSPQTPSWNTNSNSSFKTGISGIVGGGSGSLAQIYVYGETAFEVTLRGLTFDNSPSWEEKQKYDAFVNQFGVDAVEDDDVFGVTGESLEGGKEQDGSGSGASGGASTGGGATLTGFEGFTQQQQPGEDSGATLSGTGEGPQTGAAMSPNSPSSSAVSSSSSSATANLDSWGGASQLENGSGSVTGIGGSGGGSIDLDFLPSGPSEETDTGTTNNDGGRNLQQSTTESKGIQPANRFAAIAVKGHGYGDDAGPRIITIDNCKFEYHRGYAILISPGIEEPDLPSAPEFEFPPIQQQQQQNQYQGGQQQDSGAAAGADAAANAGATSTEQSSTTNDESDPIGFATGNDPSASTAEEDPFGFGAGGGGDSYVPDSNNGSLRQRNLNLLDNGALLIPKDGHITYYDNSASINYKDGRRVKIMNSEFTNNIVEDTHTAGLVTSAYSLSLTGCFFQKNSAKTMIFVYNDDALVENTVFAENSVEVATVIMSSPKSATPKYNNLGEVEPTHLVERSCFLGSNVGMSNVLATNVAKTGFGQRSNHATGTSFSWISSCEGGAAEQNGDDCLESGMCDGTCIQFTEGKCLADRTGVSGLYSVGVGVKKSLLISGVTTGFALFIVFVSFF